MQHERSHGTTDKQVLAESPPTTSPFDKSAGSFLAKTEQEKRYRQALIDDLLNQRTHYSSGPYEAHIQFSSYCNMSCIMCWDGRNPPAEKISAELLEIISEQVAPHLSVITPYSGSEPLVLSWNETRDLAREHSVVLCITTNVQYLDEKLFAELRDITETLLLSVDSHVPEILELIRPGGNIKKVLANLETTARLCKENRIECIVNVVLMTLNAPHLAETISYLGDIGIETVNIIQMLDVNGRSSYYDPLLHFSNDYIDWIKKSALKSAKAKQMRVVWSVNGVTEFDYRATDHVQPLDRKSWNDQQDLRMKRMFPGYCRMVFNRLRIDRQGDVAPCCYATQGELSLGNLNDTPFDEIWNSASARDLRRGMLCGDVPTHCSSCRFIDPIEPQADLAFVRAVDEELSQMFTEMEGIDDTLALVAPGHAARLDSSPVIRVSHTGDGDEKCYLGISLGGETDEMQLLELKVRPTEPGTLELELPNDVWQGLRTNAGYWWNVWLVPANEQGSISRSEKSFVMIRHQHLEKISGSQLKYQSDGSLPVIDLGVEKQLGFQSPDNIPGRPETIERVQAVKGSHLDEVAERRQKFQASQKNGNESSGGLMTHLHGLLFGKKKRAPGVLVRKGSNTSIFDGYLDQVIEHADYIHVVGWVLLRSGAAERVEFQSTGQHKIKARMVSRPDLEYSYPDFETASEAGFEARLKWESFKTDHGYEFDIVVYEADEEVSRTRVTRVRVESDDYLNGGPYWFGKTDHVTLR